MNKVIEAVNGVKIPQLGFGVYKIKKEKRLKGRFARLFESVIVISIRLKYTETKQH